MEISETLVKKYDIIINGNKRYYKKPLNKFRYDLECSTPVEFIFKNVSLKETSWNELTQLIAIKLHNLCPKKDFSVFVPSWKNYYPFSKEKVNKFYCEIDENLYLYRNFTASHAFMFICELMNYCGLNLNDGYLIIHRPPYAEPKEIVDSVSSQTKEAFKDFLIENYNFSDEKCTKIINNILFHMNNVLLEHVSKSYSNWFMFSDYQYVVNYVVKFKEYIETRSTLPPKNIKIYDRYLVYLKDFYKEYLSK